MSAISDLNRTVFFIDQGEITYETKGMWTWVKARCLYSKSYKLATIAEVALCNTEKYRSLIPALNVKIAKYNLLHADTQIKEIAPRIPLSTRKKNEQLTILAAVSKGRALSAATYAIDSITAKKPTIKSTEGSSQDVFLLPKEGVVFKRSKARAEEEERTINDLFDLMSGQAVVAAMTIKSTSRLKFGMAIPEDLKRRGYAVEDMDASLREAIKAKLSGKDASLLATQQVVNKPAENHPKKREEWWVKQPGEWQGQEVSFAELQKMYRREALGVDTLIGMYGDTVEPMSDQDSAFFDELNYSPSQQADSEGFYLTPDLKDPDDKRVYELCEECRWTFRDGKGNLKQVDFKAIHALYLENIKLRDISCGFNKNSTILKQEHINRALNVDWKVVGSTIIQKEKKVLSPLPKVQSKPYVEMYLMKNVKDTLREAILERLVADSEFNAVLTGEVQLLDLHDENLGVAPVPNEQYERFKELKFSTGKEKDAVRIFDSILRDYLRGVLTKESTIKVVENGETVTAKVKDIPGLQEALEVRWRLVIFDTDLSLGESNELSFLIREDKKEYKKEHLIPLRSVLFETKWKDRPLSSQVVERLQKSEERDLRVKHWIKKEDAPIYKRLSPEAREGVVQAIVSFIEKYTLSESREQKQGETIRSLRDRFVEEVASKNLELWKTIENSLSCVTVRSGDTWEKLAIRHGQNVEKLKKLNSRMAEPAEKIKIDHDLTSQSDKAIQRRKEISVQLFPRITHRQEQALLKRQECRREYLSGYQALKDENSTFEKVKKFVQHPATPLTVVRRAELLRELARTKEGSGVRERLLKECVPTYFNLMKAMYPLLADAYALNQAYYLDNKRAGKGIGWYCAPLETIIKGVDAKSPSDEVRYLIAHLELQIKKVKDPTFLVHI